MRACVVLGIGSREPTLRRRMGLKNWPPALWGCETTGGRRGSPTSPMSRESARTRMSVTVLDSLTVQGVPYGYTDRGGRNGDNVVGGSEEEWPVREGVHARGAGPEVGSGRARRVLPAGAATRLSAGVRQDSQPVR